MSKFGRPPAFISEKDRMEIHRMAMIGMRQKDIAKVKGIALITLKRHCKTELREGKSGGKNILLDTAFEMATTGKNVAMLIFLLKTQHGFRETVRNENNDKTPKDNKPVVNLNITDPIEAAKIYQEFMARS